MKQLTIEEFYALVDSTIYLPCDRIIKLHKSLIGKKHKTTDGIEDYGRNFMFKLLNIDYGYMFPKQLSKDLEEFFNSEHTSNYFKNLIQTEFEQFSVPVPKAVTSNKSISDFTEEDFEEIASTYAKIGSTNKIFALLFRLNSEGARNYLVNKADPEKVIHRIVLTSGLNDRPEFYSGRGAKMSDLNGNHLISIYNKLYKLDPQRALNMAQMTIDMDSLGATEFLESLYSLAENDYDLSKTKISTNNFSVGNKREQDRDIFAYTAIIAAFGRQTYDCTSTIKTQFIDLLPQQANYQLCLRCEPYASYKRVIK